MTKKKKDEPAVLEPELCEIMSDNRGSKMRIGIVGNYEDTDETRFLLTPEGCGMLTSSGFKICMEENAALDISFSDDVYAEYGVEIVKREQALKADIVLSYMPLNRDDIARLSDGAALLCMMGSSLFEKDVVELLLAKKITLGCFDNMYSHNDEPVFANIIDEINGRAAIMQAQEFLSYTGGGKGVLLASVAGLNPCEVLIIGEGNEVCYAAKAALAAGAYVTLMDNDISALQISRQFCGDNLNTVAIHPRVLYNKVTTADVIIIGTTTRPFEMPKKLTMAMKDNVYLINLRESQPSLSVPRTVAMALSNCVVNFLSEMVLKDGFDAMISSTSGVQCGIVTYKGKLVDKLIGSFLGMPSIDITVMLASTN